MDLVTPLSTTHSSGPPFLYGPPDPWTIPGCFTITEIGTAKTGTATEAAGVGAIAIRDVTIETWIAMVAEETATMTTDMESAPLTTVADQTTDSVETPRRVRAGSATTILRVPDSRLRPLVARVLIMGDRTSSGRAGAPRALAEIRMLSRRPWARKDSNT